jgi:hypothetical protein
MRLNFVSVLGLLSVAACSAGTIQPSASGGYEIGGVNGLTNAYITQTGAGTAACAAGPAGCVAGSATGFGERNYDSRLFSGATESGTPPLPYGTYNQTAAETGTIGQFAMINDGLNGPSSANYWDSTAAGSTLIVPVGIANVSDVWAMLNNIAGAAGGTDSSVTFNFGTSSNASSFNDVVVVTLTNSGTSGVSGQISASLVCQSAPCTFDDGNVAPNSAATATLNTNPTSGVNVYTQVLYSSAYNTVIAGSFTGSSGNVVLDAQDFNLAALVAPSASEYLVSVVVKEAAGSTGQTSLSALTVDTVPEPSTVFLFLTGLGALGIGRLRRK